MRRIVRSAPQSVPFQDPFWTIAMVRLGIPSDGPIDEDWLRALVPELDALLAEERRATDRRLPKYRLEAA